VKSLLKKISINLVRINQIEILLKIISVDLDLVVDASIDEGVNGCCISSITSTSIDNYLQPGDFIISLNHENMRKISNAQARAIIRRAALIGSDIRYYEQSLFLMFCYSLHFSIIFILGEEAKQFKEQALDPQLNQSE
jgi:hypothetical protein